LARLSGGEPHIGDVLDSRYRITGLLGSGGMGSVYRAEHVAIRRPVAIKVLHADFAGDPDYGKRFQREAFVTGRADHPNCVTVSDFGALTGGGFYLVMELVEGVVLGDLLIQLDRLPVRRALHIARHILRGLAHVHAAGIVHRDVKPNNVILVRQGEDPDFAKILDFGIAKLVDGAAADAADQQITRIGTTVGTPSYVAPEQAVGGPPDPRSDLYSLSIVLYEMITGQPPFRAEDTVKLLSKHLSAPVPAMAEVAPGLVVSPAVEELVRVGLAKDRTARHPGAAEYGAAIDELFARGLVDPPATSGIAPAHATSAPSPLAARPGILRSTRARVGAAAVGLLLVVAIVAAAGRRGGTAAPPPPSVAPALPVLVPDTRAEDARAELELGHDRIAARRPLEGLEAYRRALALHPDVASDETLRADVEAQVRARDIAVAVIAVQLLGEIGAEWALDELIELAGRDKRNAIRRAARLLADKRGAGDRMDLLSSYQLDLLHGKTCEERAEAVPQLVDLGDKRALPSLERARKRRSGGILGFGGHMVNGCMRVELDEAIARLQQL
jgi:hypothetical protein